MALGGALPLIGAGRKLAVAYGTGNQSDDNMKEFSAAMAAVCDHVIVSQLV